MVKEVKIPFENDEHAQLKSLCALKGISMRDFCYKAVLNEMKKSSSHDTNGA